MAKRQGETFASMETGEKFSNIVQLITADQQEQREYYKERIRKQKELYNMIEKECGNFFFYKYPELIEQLHNDPATAFRFLYVCTCADPDGYIYAWDNKYCDKDIDFTDVFQKPQSTTYKFLQELVDNDLIIKTKDKRYRITPDIYSTHINDTDFQHNSFRVFRNAIKHMYNNSTPREHGGMGELFRLVPYLNINYNILCHNIEETNIDYVEPLVRSEICEILRPGSDYGRKIIKNFDKYMLKNQPVFGSFNAIEEEHYFINPRILYGGNNPDKLHWLIQQFDLAKVQANRRKQRKLEVVK